MRIVGIGLEMLEIAPFERLQEAGPGALSAAFSSDELEYCLKKRHPGEHLAARMAAKRATLKALSGSDFSESSLARIRVTRKEGGQPMLVIDPSCIDSGWDLSSLHLHLSVSHSGGLAVALVVAEHGELTTGQESTDAAG